MASESIGHYCGLMGIAGDDNAAYLAYLGLYALQHRGQESAGIVSADGTRTYVQKGMGLVNDVFTPEVLEQLPGRLAIGHTRYSTTGSSVTRNIQPLLVNYKAGSLAVAHNGNLTNTAPLRDAMEREGSIFQTTTDTEIILHLVARSQQERLEDRILEALGQVDGAFSLVFSSEDTLVAVRDPRGFRPLNLGRLGDAHLFASESCAFDILGGEYVRSLEPGEMVVARNGELHSHHLAEVPTTSPCVFEFVYFSRPDSRIYGEKVDKVRRRLGKFLAREHPADADIVIAVPDSSNTAAIGYSSESGLRFEIGLIRNHYVGRTFIQPGQTRRDHDVRVKFNPVGGVLRERSVVVIDDSIVRGTTSRKLVRMLRDAGAREVHVRISSPPVSWPCYYGVDIPTREELIASSKSVEEIAEYLEADSLGYLSLEGMLEAAAEVGPMCSACFSGEYPVPILNDVGKDVLEREKSASEPE
jgi:amidophosphoribosyltransferase